MNARFSASLLGVAGLSVALAAPLAAQAPAASSAGTPRELPAELDPKLIGNRFAPLQWSDMNEAQKTMTRHVLDGPRTAMTGPFNVMLRSPVMGDLAQDLGAQVRFNSTLPAPLREMAILISARHWTAHYEWNAHKGIALTAGLGSGIVAAIATGERPGTMSVAETALYDFCSELLDTKHVSDATFAAAKAAFGEQGVAEIIFTLGYYGLVSMLLNVDEHPLPPGVEPELAPLGAR
jgi:4-carboxymuconolactone decarboxylase